MLEESPVLADVGGTHIIGAAMLAYLLDSQATSAATQEVEAPTGPLNKMLQAFAPEALTGDASGLMVDPAWGSLRELGSNLYTCAAETLKATRPRG